jgi:LPXTG-site transpeptidase (sortase) family protein
MGNTVLEGHHNINGEVFRNLINLKAGDTIKVYTLNTAQEYKVIESILVEEEGQPFEVRRANARYIQPTADIRLTLVTCWPYTGNSHRVIIVAAPDPS